MKNKLFVFILAMFICNSLVFAQNNMSIGIDDNIYRVLDSAQARGLCDFLPTVKPYSLKRIKYAIDQILENQEKLTVVERQIIENFLDKNNFEDRKKNLFQTGVSNHKEKWHCSFYYDFSFESSVSGGIYTNSDFNQVGFDFIPAWRFVGDVSKYFSYNMSPFFDISSMKLYECGNDYFIGYPWYDDGVEEYMIGFAHEEPRRRYINKFLNTSYLPYSYKKRWDGQFYYFSDLSANGTDSWAKEPGISGGIQAEIRGCFRDGLITFGAGRINREWAGMDNGSSLVYNSAARPFFGVDATVELFKIFKFSSLTGVLEYPNQDYINENSYAEQKKGIDDSYFFQNAFSLNMMELDFKYFHLDFGTSAVWPKRFELGYMFPLVLYVEYQNHIGDSANLAVFGDLKFRQPGLGSLWASIYLDEINGMNNNPFYSTRAMYACQLGAKLELPKLSFSTISIRYTKVEPYCYTHHSINYATGYEHYVSESYTNNGECLGYYLPPNSDEVFVRFDTQPKTNILANIQYQFIRHGADYGSQQVPGSSLYSEMSIYNRDELRKYFLHDGAYNWMHILNAGATVEFKKTKIPVKITANAGFLFSYYTVIDSDVYNTRDVNGVSEADETTSFHFVDNEEYPLQCGVVLSLGVTLFKF